MYRILIYLQPRCLELWQQDTLINRYPVAVGKPTTPTPTGEFSVLAMWQYPANPALGTRWIQFTWRMHGIHGTNQPGSIGQAVSLGCVRMYNHDAEHLYDHIQEGTPITISPAGGGSLDTNGSGNHYSHHHTIQSGETLWLLAQKYNIALADLIQANPLVHPENLFIGQKIKVPR